MRNLLYMKFGFAVALTTRLHTSWATSMRLCFLLVIFGSMISAIRSADTPLSEKVTHNEPGKSIDRLSSVIVPSMRFVLLSEGATGTCTSNTECCENIICYGLEYTPGLTGDMTSYTTGFFVDCINNN